MTDFDKMNRKIKHLEFIQSNISRMNQCSFKMKGWMITIDSALLALFAASIDKNTGSGNTIYLFVAAIPIIIFWILDSYYLQHSRCSYRISFSIRTSFFDRFTHQAFLCGNVC